MNRKQKMIKKAYNNYLHNCNAFGEKPISDYLGFRNTFRKDTFEYIYELKNRYKENRI